MGGPGAEQYEGHADIGQQTMLCAGVMALQNLPAEAMAEAAIAAALLLEHTPLGAGLLLRPGALTAFINAVLDENSSPLQEIGERPFQWSVPPCLTWMMHCRVLGGVLTAL